MTHFLNLLRWESILLVRNKLVQVSLIVTALYIGLFQLLKQLGNTELFAILLTLNDPALIGMLFVAVTILYERESGSLSAIWVSPLRMHAYLCAKLVSLSLLGMLCGWAMTLALVGTGIHHLVFVVTCFGVTWLFGCLGIILVARLSRFVDFLLPMAGTLVLMVVPLADWFGLLPIPFKSIFPLEHGIRLLAWSMQFRLDAFPVASMVVLLITSALAYVWAYKRFSNSQK